MKQPSSVAHYTSLDVINVILNNAQSSDEPVITMHLSFLSNMNDINEGEYVLREYFRNSTLKNQLKEKWEKYFFPKNQPFIFSTIATDRYSVGRGSLPMWKMYGDNCKGALIRFNTKKLHEFCNKNGYKFAACNYSKTKDVDDLIKKFNHEHTPFNDILYEACLTKSIVWKYEKEWRIVCLANEDKIYTKSTARGIVSYIKIQIPLDIVEEICLGPLANENISLSSLNILRDKLSAKFPEQVHFKINKSKITIQ